MEYGRVYSNGPTLFYLPFRDSLKTEGKRTLVKPKRRREDNIKMDNGKIILKWISGSEMEGHGLN